MIEKRILNLDLFRAFAIILVLYFHVFQHTMVEVFTNAGIYSLGKFGVNLFFSLSGFLIAGIYYLKPKNNILKFWLRRFIRTYFPYLITLILSWLAVNYYRGEEFNWGYLIMIQNFYPIMPFFLVSWSLCIEEHFYILFSLVIFFTSNLRIQNIIWIVLTVIAISSRLFISDATNEDFGINYTNTIYHIDSIALGVLTAFIYHKLKPKYVPVKFLNTLLPLLIILTCYIIIDNYNNYTFSIGLFTLNILSCTLIFNLASSRTLNISNYSITKLTSKISYSIYLLHPLIIHITKLIFSKLQINNYLIHFCTTILLIYLISYMFYTLVESKILKFKDLYLK